MHGQSVGGLGMLVHVTDRVDPAFVFCDVEASDNPNEAGRRDENVMFAMFKVSHCFKAVAEHPLYRDWPPQPQFLYAIRVLVEAQNGGRRDEVCEQDVFSHWISHHGLPALAKLFGKSPS